MTPKPGQRVLTPHPTMMGPGKIEGRYVGAAPPHKIGPMLDGHTEHVQQGVVEYADGTRKTWPVDAIEAAPTELLHAESPAGSPVQCGGNRAKTMRWEPQRSATPAATYDERCSAGTTNDSGASSAAR